MKLMISYDSCDNSQEPLRIVGLQSEDATAFSDYWGDKTVFIRHFSEDVDPFNSTLQIHNIVDRILRILTYESGLIAALTNNYANKTYEICVSCDDFCVSQNGIIIIKQIDWDSTSDYVTMDAQRTTLLAIIRDVVLRYIEKYMENKKIVEISEMNNNKDE